MPVLLARYVPGALHAKAMNGRQLPRLSADDAVAAVDAHGWPGNVRELENRMKRAVIMTEGRHLTAADLELVSPEKNPAEFDLRAARQHAERAVIQRALTRAQGRLSGTAKLLGISRPTLYSLMDAHGLATTSTTSATQD